MCSNIVSCDSVYAGSSFSPHPVLHYPVTHVQWNLHVGRTYQKRHVVSRQDKLVGSYLCHRRGDAITTPSMHDSCLPGWGPQRATIFHEQGRENIKVTMLWHITKALNCTRFHPKSRGWYMRHKRGYFLMFYCFWSQACKASLGLWHHLEYVSLLSHVTGCYLFSIGIK